MDIFGYFDFDIYRFINKYLSIFREGELEGERGHRYTDSRREGHGPAYNMFSSPAAFVMLLLESLPDTKAAGTCIRAFKISSSTPWKS